MGGITIEDMTAAGALLEGHFKLSSGRHSSRYMQCALYLAEPARAEAAGRQLAARLKSAAAQIVVAPALGGVIIGHEVARALVDVPFFFTERADGEMVLRRGFVVGVAAIVNRAGQENPFAPLPFTALLTVEVPSWAPEACPLCASGVPLAKPGSRPDAIPR